MGDEFGEGEAQSIRVVSNTGPLLHLLEANVLHLLIPLSPSYIPDPVEAELMAHAPTWRTIKPKWVRVRFLEDYVEHRARQWMDEESLDSGEAFAFGLAEQIHADLFLTDDQKARRFAEFHRVSVMGSIGVLKRAVIHRDVQPSEALAIFDRLIETSIWLSNRLISETRYELSSLLP